MTTDLMAAKEIERQLSVTADIKARMPHLDHSTCRGRLINVTTLRIQRSK